MNWEKEIKYHKDKVKYYKELQKSYRRAIIQNKDSTLINKIKNIFYTYKFKKLLK
jgi:hypothetical protein